MWGQPIPFGAVAFGTAYIGCGLVQLTAGTVFLVHPTVLRIGSNVWTGLFNIVFGCLLLNTSRHTVKPRTFIVVHTGVLLVNLCNLLLMELREWRAFLATNRFRDFIRNGDVTTLIAVYFSTTVPTVVAFVVSFLAAQYNCCVLVTKETERNEAANRNQASIISSSSNSTVVYDWVFHEDHFNDDDDGGGESEQPGEQSSLDLIAPVGKRHLRKQSSVLSPSVSVLIGTARDKVAVGDDSAMQTFSSPFRNVPTTFHPGNWSNVLTNKNDNVTKQPSAVPRIIEQDDSKYYGRNAEPLSEDAGHASEACDDITSESLSESLQRQQQQPARPTREVLSRLRVCEHVVHSDDVPRVEWRPPSQTLTLMPMTMIDGDSLVHLRHLELLARQWRIEHEHQKLHRMAKLMIRNSQRNDVTQSKA